MTWGRQYLRHVFLQENLTGKSGGNIDQDRYNTNKYKQNAYREKTLAKSGFLNFGVCMCMYLYVLVLYFEMYFVCIVCISQNVSVSMRLATFPSENTSKYIQYRQIHASYIHQFYQNTYKNTYKISQLLCVCLCMYMHVHACILSVCLYFLHPKT